MSRVVVIKEVLENYARCSRPTLYRWIQAGLFPEPIHVGKRICWTVEALDRWLATREVGTRRRQSKGVRP